MPHRRLFKKTDSWEYGFETRAQEQPLAPPKKRRTASTLMFAAMFFAGAAFAAFAGDQLTQLTSDSSATEATADAGAAPASTDATATDTPAADATATDATATDATASPDASASPDAATASAPADSASPDATATPDTSAAPAADTSNSAPEEDAVAPRPSSDGSAADSSASSATPTTRTKPMKAAAKPLKSGRLHKPMRVVLLPATRRPASPPEIEGPAQNATIWLNSPLPDPTPAAMRLSKKFARHLQSATRDAGVDWALELAILRAKGFTGHNPAGRAMLRALATRLGSFRDSVKGDWAIALAYDGSPDFADKVQALARYDRAVGLRALVHGLESAKKSLGQRLLDDPAISIYPGGRDDIANNKVDVRVLAMISYLHQAFGEVTVSCLIAGHRLYARPGVISAHIYGRAVDIAALGGTSILGHQEPGGITEQAVKDILLLPSEVMPKQVISLLGLGGPSFPLADHYNHIHIGY
jgi:hypothetical protein